jgi:hypothetical protein
MRQLVFVHGREQQGKDAVALKGEWIKAFEVGLGKSKLTLPIGESQVRFPFYGDTLHQMTEGVSSEHAAAIVVRGQRFTPEEEIFLLKYLSEVIEDRKVTAAIAASPDDQKIRRGILNTSWAQSVLAALDRHVPFVSAASLALLTRDVHQYLTNRTFRKTMDEGVGQALEPTKESVVVSHSLGTVVAYNVLKGRDSPVMRRDFPDIPLFVTLGSPLAVKAVKAKLAPPVASPQCVGQWFNAMDERDVVSLFPLTSEHFPVFPEIVNKVDVDNFTENRHGIAGYLSDQTVARRIYDALTAP